jgi:hypothetical protein
MKANQIYFLFSCSNRFIEQYGIFFSFNKVSQYNGTIELFNFSEFGYKTITEKILKPYLFLRQLALCCSCKKVKNLNHFILLKELVIGNKNSGVTNRNIRDLKRLKKLILFSNKHITDFNYLTSLEELIIFKGPYIMSNNSIKNLTNLKTLHLHYANDITDINHLKQLENLYI